MNIYRDNKTGRLVKLFLCTPMKFIGQWVEAEDIATRSRKRVPESQMKRYTMVGVR